MFRGGTYKGIALYTYRNQAVRHTSPMLVSVLDVSRILRLRKLMGLLRVDEASNDLFLTIFIGDDDPIASCKKTFII